MKKEPLRKCLATNEKIAKKELIRVVRNNEGKVFIDLTGKAKCNVAEYVTPTNGFPYIFFTIKAPTTADAGTWSGWACRISYIWPYTPSTTQLTN
mgnify:CR=1 FL=1